MTRVLATIEARMASTRLPGKVMLPINGAPMLQRLAERLAGCRAVDAVKILTTDRGPDEIIATLCQRLGFPVFRGSEDDVTARLVEGTAAEAPEVIVQLTGDNPLVDCGLIDDVVHHLLDGGYDYVSNSLGRHVVIGLNVRALRRDALVRMDGICSDPLMRVHGGYYIQTRPDLFKIGQCPVPDGLDRQDVRLTVDEPADYELVRRIAESLGTGPEVGWQAILDLLAQRPELAAINSAVRQKKPGEG
ncbi:MAG: cytidylyltransferase domain-containing protein [Actinomycetota bacterium]